MRNKSNLGTFTSYNLEYIYDFIGEDRIKRKLEELKNVPTMGTSFEKFLTEETEFDFNEKRVLWKLWLLINNYFKGELDVCLFIYENSKKYTESDYNNDNFWLDYHFLYQSILDNLKIFDKKNKLILLNIEGNYGIQKKLLVKENTTLEIKKRRSPGTGKYLFVKNSNIISDIWFDLYPENNEETKFLFTIDWNGIYILELGQNSITIHKKEEIYFEDKNNLKELNIKSLVNELSENYLNNLETISKIFQKDNKKIYKNNPPLFSNGVLWNLLDFYIEDETYQNKIIKFNNKFSRIWNEM
ncbi:MAG: hypothetical protein FJZ67_12360 [Bacteroidetes bacterium]|nr:hypothetical protein [Bacteroidota bacterium]